MVGDPIPLMKAFELEKYDKIETKYRDNYFKIPYMTKFKEIFFEGKHVPATAK